MILGQCQPCNCTEELGFSNSCQTDDINKCECKENYYRPVDTPWKCVPCNCDRLGANSPNCSSDTGACQCRPGVLGRQCDKCSNKERLYFSADQFYSVYSYLTYSVSSWERYFLYLKKYNPLKVCRSNFERMRDFESRSVSTTVRSWRQMGPYWIQSNRQGKMSGRIGWRRPKKVSCYWLVSTWSEILSIQRAYWA